jgi:hypothetical protein
VAMAIMPNAPERISLTVLGLVERKKKKTHTHTILLLNVTGNNINMKKKT